MAQITHDTGKDGAAARNRRHSVATAVIGWSAALFVAFEAGILFAHRQTAWQAWSWDSPWGRISLIAAAVWAGISIAVLLRSRLRDAEADNVLQNIAETRAYTQSLMARIEQVEPSLHSAGGTHDEIRPQS